MLKYYYYTSERTPKVDEKLINPDELEAHDSEINTESEKESNASIETQSEKEDAECSPSDVYIENSQENSEDASIEDSFPEKQDEEDTDETETECEQESFSFSSEDENEDYPENFSEDVTESEEEEKETILSPDELFADRYLDAKIFEGDSEESDEIGEIIEEDGQYRLTYNVEEPEEEEEEADEFEFEEEEEKAPKYNPEKPRRIDSRFDLVELFVFTLLAVMIVTSFFFRHSIVDGESMEGTLHAGEHLIISDFLYTPKRGDIVVCEDYTTPIKKPIVKRVIAIEGDTVRITENGEVYVNDKLLDESAYVYIDDPYYAHEPLSLTVEKGEIFVMGDHRNQSTDSRNEAVGTLSVDSVIGKVLLRFYPFSQFGAVK